MASRPDLQDTEAGAEAGAGAAIGARRKALHELRLFFLALQFFTRLPVPRWVGFEADWQRHAIRYFPAVGLVTGIVSSAVYALAMLFWPPLLAVLLAVGAGIWMTGAMHEDGIADTCDGLGAGGGAERILRIMRDSHIGVFGVLGLAMTLALKCAALVALPPHHACIALLLAHPLSRLACFPLIRKLHYLREEGKAKALAERITAAECWIGVATVLPLVLLAGIGGWLPRPGLLFGLVLASLSVWWLARLFDKRIGGYTGDCLGAVQQAAEAMFYLGLAAALRI